MRDLRADAIAELPAAFATVVAATRTPVLRAVVDYVAPRMRRGRVALLGDAAAAVRPHTVMGVAKAAGDAVALAGALRALPVTEALSRYEQERLPAARAIAEEGCRVASTLLL